MSICVVAVSKFCEAIAEYMANISSAPDPNVQLEFFSGEVCSAWEIFYNVWLGSKEAKVNCLTFVFCLVGKQEHHMIQ